MSEINLVSEKTTIALESNALSKFDDAVLITGNGDGTFPNAPNSKVKWKLECMLVDAEESYKTFELYNKQEGKQSLAMHKIAGVISSIKDILFTIKTDVDHELKQGNFNASAI